MEKQSVTVLARDYATGLSAIRALGAAGYSVDLVGSVVKQGEMDIAAQSKYVRHVEELVRKKSKGIQQEEVDQLVEVLVKNAPSGEEKPVLFPADDYMVSMIDQSRSRLESYYRMPGVVDGTDGCLTKYMDKALQAEMARKAGLKTPKEWYFSLKEEEITIPADMEFPCFCKPVENITGNKKEMAVCEDEEALLNHLNKLRESHSDRAILVQEYLEIDQEISLPGVCLDQQIILPAVVRKTQVSGHRRGAAIAGTLAPIETLGDVQEKAIALLKQFRYYGMFDLELNIVGDKIYFNEVNLRSSVPSYACFKSGVNLPALFVGEILGRKHTAEETKISAFGKTFFYEKAAWGDYIHGFITYKELRSGTQKADITLLHSKVDPEPDKLFLKVSKKQVIRYKKKQIRHAAGKIVRPILRKIRPYLMNYPQIWKKNARGDHPRVMIVGRNYASNLCLARSFGAGGYEVEILRVYQRRPKLKNILQMVTPDAYSKYVKAFYVCSLNGKSKNLVKMIQRLADHNHKMLLIPADDLAVSIVDENYDELKELYQISNVGGCQGGIVHLMSKQVQEGLARAAGLPVVNSCMIRSQDGKFEIPDEVRYPCFIKPNISKNGSKTKMRRCDTREELHEALSELSRNKNFEMIVEDFVDIRKEYAMLGLTTKTGTLAPGFFRTDIGGHDARRGIAMFGEVLPVSDQQELIDKIVKFVSTLGYEGLFDVDLIENTDGQFYFVELNLRYGGSGYAITKSGANLPAMYADYMLKNKPVDLSCRTEPGKTFINERVLLGEYVDGYLTYEETEKWMKSVDIHFIHDNQDPKAYRHLRLFLPLMASERKKKEKKKRMEASLQA